ncbi:GroES family chaperonin [Cellulosimicrobium composti]|uniref:GroES family chaperonin n=1 Tax=Cellulosimicrobium composti TaxID=2672572 RepID=UPI00298E584B|nr:co-chaperone GroES [Cellulosimicrobium composti]
MSKTTSAPSTTARPARTTARDLPIRMLHDRLLVEPEVDASERQSSAGLVIPATAVGPKRLAWAVVVAAGEHVRQVAVGDRVLFDPDDRAEVELGGKDLVLLRERDVHAVSQDVEEDGPTGLYL